MKKKNYFNDDYFSEKTKTQPQYPKLSASIPFLAKHHC